MRARAISFPFCAALLVLGAAAIAPQPVGASAGPSAKSLAATAVRAAKAAQSDARRAGGLASAARSAAASAKAATAASTAARSAASAAQMARQAAAVSSSARAHTTSASRAAGRARTAARHASRKGAAAARRWAARAQQASRTAVSARNSAASAAKTAARYAVTARAGAAAFSKACGGEVPHHSDGTAYRCTFDDEFDGTGLDTSKWSVLKTSEYGFHSGPECYVDDGQHVTVGGGVLNLVLTRASQPKDCAVEKTRYLSGMVYSGNKFSQAYGRFEIRAKLPAGIGLQPALWLYPQNLTYGNWPNSGEIDIAEAFGLGVPSLLPNLLPDLVWPHLHYQGALGPAAPGTMCDVPGSTTGYHTYAVDWTPQAITFIYDGRTCGAYTWYPSAPLKAPAPFDQPFYICLTLALGNMGANVVSDLLTPFPSKLSIDYVRVWK